MNELIRWRSENDGIIPLRAQATLELLDELKIEWQAYLHAPHARVKDAAAIRHLFPAGIHSKSLFVQEGKKEEARFYLFTCRADKRIDWAKLSATLNKKRFSFGDEALLAKYFDVGFGEATPLAFAYKNAHEVTPLMDEEMAHAPLVYMHPCVNIMSVAIKGEDMCRFVHHHHQAPLLVAPTIYHD